MTKALAELNHAGDRVEVHFRYDADLVRSIKEVPNARFVPPNAGGPFWMVPLSLDVMRRLREELGDRLVLGQALREWGKEAVQREKTMHAMAATDDVPLADLKIATKLPKLAEWFRPYQRADVKFLSVTSALNLNQPGLGKTTEIIGAVFEADLENGAHLVVAPKTSLETVWRYEIERWTADLEKPHEVITYHGDMSTFERDKAVDEFWACIDEDWPVWFVCTPHTVRDAKEPAVEEWNTFTIDEYHKTGLPNAGARKGSGTKFSQAVKEINSKRRFAVTGTPMGGKPIKLWGALNFLYPKQFTSKWAWARTWLVMNSNGWGTDIGGIQPGREAEFYEALAPYVVRRLKSEVLPQLPAKQYVDVWCDMTPKQAKQYKEFAARAEAEIEEKKLNALGILAQYTRLKQFADAYVGEIRDRLVKCEFCEGTGDWPGQPGQLCPTCDGIGKQAKPHLIPSTDSGKLPALWERLNEVGIDVGEDADGDACAVISTQFRDMAEMIHKWLTDKGIKSELITGAVQEHERVRIQQEFQAGGPDAPRVVVMVTTAGGVAITLDRADTVHIMDETWVPDDQEQLEDRIHRASRMHQVTCYYYRSKDTVEEYIHEMTKDKAAINKEILDLRRQGFRADVRAHLAEEAAA